MNYRKLFPIFFAPDDGTGAGATDAPVEGAPVEGAPVEGAPVEGAPVEGAPAAVDWNQRVTEWGGEASINEAIELKKALATREGINALAWESLRALGIGDDRINQLFNPQAAGGAPVEQEETVEQLLADPERILTAAEINRVLQHQAKAQESARTAEQAKAAISSTITSTFAELGIADDDPNRTIVLNLADRFLGKDALQATPQEVASAMKQAHTQFTAMVQKAADDYLKTKAETHQNLPTPLTGGTAAAGSEEAEEPKTVAEAISRVRAAVKAASAQG